MRKREIKDKLCSDCGKFIMRASSYCRGCSQKGDRSIRYIVERHFCFLCKGKKSRNIETKICQKCLRGKNYPNYKEKVGYVALHYRIRNILGIAFKCENKQCNGKSKTYQWANISGEYKYSLDDWMQLCRSCHAKYDRSKKSRFKEYYYGN